MADKNSTYISEFENGQTVDSILKRAMVGGAIDKSLSEKAPAGYGLGENAQSWFSSDFNDYTSNGWWRFGSVASFTNAPPLGYGVLRVDCRESYLCQQTFYALGNGIIMRRYHNGATWSEWEYVNPPMTPGVEYRTTKRYREKVVYAKLVDMGAMPNGSGSLKYPENNNLFGGAAVELVMYRVAAVKGNEELPLPYVEYTANTNVNVYFATSATNGHIMIRTGSAFTGSGYNAVAYLEYIKTAE